MQLRFSQIHVTILNFVLIGALAIVSAMCVRDVMTRAMSNDTSSREEASSARAASVRPLSRPYYDQIVKRDIFNLVPQQVAPPPVVVEDLHLKLLGTSIQSKSKPYAIVEDPQGNQALYQVGEDIPDAGRLVSVEVNRAIINHDGHRVAIDIPSEDLPDVPASRLGAGIRMPNSSPAAVMRRFRGGRGRVRPGASEDGDDSDSQSDDDSSKLELKKLGPGKFEASRAEVEQTMENPAEFFTQMRALPHFVNGKTDGFSISQVAPGSVFEQLGLQNGDLLTQIQGQPVTNPMQAMALMQQVKTASSIDLLINRGGTPTSVHLDLR